MDSIIRNTIVYMYMYMQTQHNIYTIYVHADTRQTRLGWILSFGTPFTCACSCKCRCRCRYIPIFTYHLEHHCIHMCICICIYIYTHICACVDMYIYTHIHMFCRCIQKISLLESDVVFVESIRRPFVSICI